MPLCFLVYSLNEVPGAQLASNELVQQNQTNQPTSQSTQSSLLEGCSFPNHCRSHCEKTP